ncbi:MAG: 6-bladed beta-propeller, partial [Candidatus Aminicenantes bacterium]|nr:6-bladed beta-propeller [Candidatus Aminicenantes bacterium]
MRKHSKQIKWIASCLLITAQFSILLLAQEVKIETNEGVVVVHNPKMPVDLPGIPSTLKLREDLRVGIESGDENYMFSQLYSIQVSDEEEIIAYDGQEVSIKVYNKNGKFVRKFGQIGQGPGEIQKPAAITLTGNNLITILDPRNRRFSYHTLEGECLKEIPTGKDRPLEAKADSSGNIYGYVLILGNTATLDLVKFNQEFRPIITINSR